MKNILIKEQRITVDLLLWRLYRSRGQALVEQTFAINSGLAAFGVFLPLGTKVNLPEPPRPDTSPKRKVITLFD